MKNYVYYWYAAIAYIRGFLGWKLTRCNKEMCVTGLNSKHEARNMFVKHGWVPYVYRKPTGGNWKQLSRAFITVPVCRCGCGQRAEWLISGYSPEGTYEDEPVCNSTAKYVEECAAECCCEFSKKRIAA